MRDGIDILNRLAVCYPVSDDLIHKAVTVELCFFCDVWRERVRS